MAKAHSGDAYVALDDSGAVLRDISQHVQEVSGIGKEYEPLDDTGLGQSARVAGIGLENPGDMVLRGIWDDAATTGFHTVVAGIVGGTTARTLTYGPEGSATGDVRFTVEVLCIALRPPVRVGERVMEEAVFRATGAVTIDTFP